MKTTLLIIALSLPIVFGCEKAGTDNGLPPLENVDNVCLKMDDINFMKYCYENFDANKDGKVSMLEANAVFDIECNTASSFAGIEYFTNLQTFKSDSVKYINLDYNTKLVSIDCCFSPYGPTMDLRRHLLLTNVGFRGCDNLVKILLADEAPIESSYRCAFASCPNLYYVWMPDTIEYIGDYTGSGCPSLKVIKMPKNLKIIARYAFLDNQLDTVKILAMTPPELHADVFGKIDVLQVAPEAVEAYKNSDWAKYVNKIVPVK